eukprot:352492-Chlamydomonas_euryale.AAC.3
MRHAPIHHVTWDTSSCAMHPYNLGHALCTHISCAMRHASIHPALCVMHPCDTRLYTLRHAPCIRTTCAMRHTPMHPAPYAMHPYILCHVPCIHATPAPVAFLLGVLNTGRVSCSSPRSSPADVRRSRMAANASMPRRRLRRVVRVLVCAAPVAVGPRVGLPEGSRGAGSPLPPAALPAQAWRRRPGDRDVGFERARTRRAMAIFAVGMHFSAPAPDRVPRGRPTEGEPGTGKGGEWNFDRRAQQRRQQPSVGCGESDGGCPPSVLLEAAPYRRTHDIGGATR